MFRSMYNQNIIILLFTVLFFSACNFAPGTYAHAEGYFLGLAKEELIDKVSEFKTTYPKYRPMRIQEDGTLKEVKDRVLNNRNLFYFYLSDHDLMIRCVLIRNSKDIAGIGFYGVSHTDFTSSKRINTSYFNRKENKYYKKLFEEEVLTPFKEFIVNQ